MIGLSKVILFCLGFNTLIGACLAHATRTQEDSKNAALVLGQWFSNTAAHYDFLSATSLTPVRSRKVLLQEKSPILFSSDYGVSHMQAPLSSGAINSIRYFQSQSASVASKMNLTRFHAAWSLSPKYDTSLSYIYSDQINGWGVALRRVLHQNDRVYYSYRLSYSNSSVSGWYRGDQLTNEFLVSLDTGLIDFYGGIRHALGQVTFTAPIPQLQLPDLPYFSNLKDLDYFVGLIWTSTTNTRVTFQTNYQANELKLIAKLSFRFDELYPMWGNWFGEPRPL